MKHKIYLKCNGTWQKLFGKNKDSFIAGDDDQAIFRWAGADVDSFIAQKGKNDTYCNNLTEYLRRCKFADGYNK